MPFRTPLGKQELTVSTTAVGLTLPASGPRPDGAVVTVESNPVRYWVDGSTPTATAGHLLNPGDALELIGIDSLKLVEFIRQGGADGELKITYFLDYTA